MKKYNLIFGGKNNYNMIPVATTIISTVIGIFINIILKKYFDGKNGAFIRTL